MLTISRRLEFDAGHRIPDHRSSCRHLHGHRYALEITLRGTPVCTKGAPNRGMVMDFKQVKSLAIEHLVRHWDHAFLVYFGDTLVRTFLDSLPDHKTVVLDCIPTVENLAVIAFDTLAPIYNRPSGLNLQLEYLRLFETPNCWAEARMNTAKTI